MPDEHKQDEAQARDKQWLLQQTDVHYTPVSMTAGEACAGCRWFISQGSWDSSSAPACHLVSGYPLPIQPTGYCDRYEALPVQSMEPTPIQVVIVDADDLDEGAAEFGAKRTISQDARDKLPAEDFAGPNRTYFIAKPGDVKSAADLVGKADDPGAVKAKIIAIAKRKGAAFVAQLPDNWKPGKKSLRERIAEGVDKRLKDLMLLPEQASSPLVGGFKVFKDATGQDRWLAWYSNNFEDREQEYFREKGFDSYVQRLDMGVVSMPELWSWHMPGTRYGEADWVDRVGHFHIATGTYDDSPAGRAGKAYDIEHAKEYGVSHGFLFSKADVESIDGKLVYKDWNTFEISPLPLHRAANALTAFAVEVTEGVKEITMDAEKRKHLADKFKPLGGEEFVAKLESEAEKRGKDMEQLRGYKDFVHPDGGAATPNQAAIESAEKSFAELITGLTEDSGEAVAASLQAVKAVTVQDTKYAALEQRVKAQDTEIAAIRAELNLKPKSVTQGGGAVLDAEKGKELYQEVEKQLTETDAFWSTQVSKTPAAT